MTKPSQWVSPAVNFINILRTNFLYEYDVSAAFPNNMYVEKAAETTFVWKTREYVDEIDTREHWTGDCRLTNEYPFSLF